MSKKCIHGADAYRCKSCLGVSICEHNDYRYRCKMCKDPKDIMTKRIIMKSRQFDKKKRFYDEDNFIDYEFVRTLMKDNIYCVYCLNDMEYVNYGDSLCTIERIDNNIGHIKSNCTLCCLFCNRARYGEYLRGKK